MLKFIKTLITAALMVAAVSLPAQNKCAGINLSLWNKLSTQPYDTLQTSFLNLGISSLTNQLKGVSINAFSSVVKKNMNGVQISGLANIVGNKMRGVQLSGIANVNGSGMSGISATGLVVIAGNHSNGIILSGLTNIVGNNLSGASISGLLNVVGENSSGIQLSGLANISGSNTKGVMTSGLLNIVSNDLSGVQLAGLANITGSSLRGVSVAGLFNIVGDNLSGLQISGFSNISAKRVQGVQIGLFNFSETIKGVQLGLVNYYKKELKGLQLGLINMNPSTHVQLMLSGGNTTKINAGVRFKNKLFYTILGLGSPYFDFNDKFSASAFYRAGVAFNIYKGFSISSDLGYQHIETFQNNNVDIPKRLYGLQGRINLEYMFNSKFGLFGTGGYGYYRHYDKSVNFDKGLIAEAGLIYTIK